MTVASAISRPKVRKTLTLDADIVEKLSADDPASLSAAVNAILRAEQERRMRAESIHQLAADLDAINGPVDPEELAQAVAILS